MAYLNSKDRPYTFEMLNELTPQQIVNLPHLERLSAKEKALVKSVLNAKTQAKVHDADEALKELELG